MSTPLPTTSFEYNAHAASAQALRPSRQTRVPASGRVLVALLGRLARGALVLHAPGGATWRFDSGIARGERAEFTLRDWRVAREVLMGGDVAFAEAYLDNRWDTPDLVGLLSLLAGNQSSLEAAFYGRRWPQALLRFRHALNANSRRRARTNIAAHYDLGNEFYALWLDETMTYSAALWGDDEARPLAAAQRAKYDRIIAELALPAGAHILEIGCGWGGFAEEAARAGYRVSGISLSSAQTKFARERIARCGLSDRVDLRIEDYRDVRGRYDGVASIEMFEAVGEKWWPAYFRVLHDALTAGGRAVIQTITIDDARFERYCRQSDFLQQYIFPGGMLSSPSRFAALAHDAGFAIERVEAFGRDYARTLLHWLANFDARIDDVRRMGFDERFVRCWRFYLAYCAAGFESGTTDVAQYTLRKL